MRNGTKLACYGGALALTFGLAWGIGSTASAVGGWYFPAVRHDGHGASAAAGHDHGAMGGHAHGGSATGQHTGGLAVTDSGYTLVMQQTTFPPGTPAELAFTITGSDGRAVTAFDVEYDRRLHLVVVRRDATGFQHLHPDLDAGGVWRTRLTLPTGGVYRAFADFIPTGGPALTLGADLFAPGQFAPVDPLPSQVDRVDGYEVRLSGDVVAGGTSQLVATVSRDGRPVTDLEPYLGAFGHLVALRHSDLAYLHVHPTTTSAPRPTDRAGPQVAFTAEIPSPATYRLFLDFQHAGAVHTAEFTMTTADFPTAR